MTNTFRDRHVVVTGGGGGLGGAIAAAFAAEGDILTLMGRTEATLQARANALRQTFGLQVEAAPCDVTDATSVAFAFETAVRALGPVHVLVNNAGHATASMFQETTLAQWQQAIDVNGTFLHPARAAAMLAASIVSIVDGGTERIHARFRLLRREARCRRPHARARHRDGPHRHHRECRVSGLH
jgi:NAD(P)-dependent dehydrogenase (short-subunit alcohol dehydrogenase family)